MNKYGYKHSNRGAFFMPAKEIKMNEVRETLLEMTKGDTFYLGVELVGFDTTLDAAYFTVKANKEDDTFVFQKTLSDGISAEDENKYKVRVAPEDTADLDTGWYYYGLELHANGDVSTVLKGPIHITWDSYIEEGE